jgi:gas vesicle protein
MDDNDGSRFFYFLTGLGMGALIGVLFAPQSGERTRELIADKAEEGREFLLSKSRELRNQAADYVERGKEVLAEQREQLVAAVDAGKKAYRAESQSKGNP